ncbi:MAG TPA: response regulator transcription factor [Thermoanaerobaculia bacterium]|nr:response regulator transcription factor [Thermoanaerobaculia bacterium]
MNAAGGGGVIRVLVVDDHPVVRGGLVHLLASRPELKVVGEAASVKEALAVFRAELPDVTLIDLSLPDGDGTEVIAELLREQPAARFIVLSVHTGSEDVYRAIKSGALGYLVKDTGGEEIVAAIRSVHAGRRHLSAAAASSLSERIAADQLTDSERRVLELMARGSSNKAIAAALHLAEGTVKTHVASILRKLQASSRSEAIVLAFRRGLVHPR